MSEPFRAQREPIRPRPPTPPPNGGIPKRGLSDLQARLLTASVLVPYILIVIAQGGLWVLGTVVVVTLLAQREFYGLIEDKGAHPIMGFGLAYFMRASVEMKWTFSWNDRKHLTNSRLASGLVSLISYLMPASSTRRKSAFASFAKMRSLTRPSSSVAILLSVMEVPEEY